MRLCTNDLNHPKRIKKMQKCRVGGLQPEDQFLSKSGTYFKMCLSCRKRQNGYYRRHRRKQGKYTKKPVPELPVRADPYNKLCLRCPIDYCILDCPSVSETMLGRCLLHVAQKNNLNQKELLENPEKWNVKLRDEKPKKPTKSEQGIRWRPVYTSS